jgi:phosphate transport system substrate-binding protein
MSPRKPLVWLVVVAAAALTACGGVSSSAPASSPPPPSADLKLGNPTKATTINESGSSLVLPFLQRMVDPVKGQYSNLTLAPTGGGSGKGISDAIAGAVQVGGSDAYLPDAQAKQHPELLNVPIAISAQAINYNVPGVNNLKLDGDTVAKIYEGHITKWNDPAIAALNSGANLPDTGIVPVRRVEASGDTFIFTSLLNATNPEWSNGPAFGTTVTWPAVPTEITATGNPGMVQVCKGTPGCIAYIGVSVEKTATDQGLGEAMIKNRAGNFLTPTAATITAAANQGATKLPDDLRAPLIYLDGAQSYPIVNFEYMIVSSKQTDADTAIGLRDFLAYAVDPAQGSAATNLSAVNFVALPSSVAPKVKNAIAQIASS